MTRAKGPPRAASVAPLRAKRPRVVDEPSRELRGAGRELPKFEERIGTGSVIDFLFAPFLMVTNGLGWTHREPRLGDRRDRWLALGFYTVAAIIAVLRQVL